tara:strand:- start:136 stop:306 length:171 start_codon:yes stop_codon:yes gene_type:complete
MEALNKLKEYAIAKDDWYITNQIWYIENEISIAISKAKIEVYESIEKNNELTTKNK